MNVLEKFKKRMSKVGVECEFFGNYPWIYLDRVNGKKVTETFQGNHGFTIALLPLRDEKMQITDIGETMKVIRKYR